MNHDETSRARKTKKKEFDLAERTAKFGESVIAFANTIPVTPVTMPLIGQLVRAGTSPGANYNEADDAVSKKEFRNKIGTCRQESRESKYWLRMIATAVPERKESADLYGWRQENST